MINQLTIVHCQLNSKTSVSAELNEIRTVDFCFVPMTCARQIYIYIALTPDNKNKLMGLCDDLKDKTQKIEVLHSYEAYAFLLRWAVGLESDKYKQNDRFVLGKLREFWTNYLYYEKNSPFLKLLLTVIPVLLRHSGIVRSYIEEQSRTMDDNTRTDIAHQYCQYLVEVAKNPDASDEVKPVFIRKAVTRQELESRLKRLDKGILNLQKDMPDGHLQLAPRVDDQVSIAQLRKFSVAIQRIQEKHQLEEQIGQLRDFDDGRVLEAL